MTREADVVRSLVEMADTLVDDYDVVDLLTGVADRCVSLLGVSAAGVMLASPAGSLALVASSSEAMRLLELFELQEQEGPCLDAFRTGERVGHENLDAGSGRWPSFSAAALQAGFASASALPLRLRDVTLGALNLLSVTRAPMGEADVIVARAFADLATLSIAQHRASAEAQRLNEQLSGALTSRVVIEQAKGVISERAGAETSKIFLETVIQFLEAAGRGSRPAERSVGPVRHGSPEVTVAATDSARGAAWPPRIAAQAESSATPVLVEFVRRADAEDGLGREPRGREQQADPGCGGCRSRKYPDELSGNHRLPPCPLPATSARAG
jgi:GAF domain